MYILEKIRRKFYYTIKFSFSAVSVISSGLHHSTQQPALRAEVSPSCLLALVWRTSVQRRSSSAAGPRAPATTSPTSTASGSPLWIPGRSLSIHRRRRPWREASSFPESAAAKSAASSCSRRWRLEKWRDGRRETSGGDTRNTPRKKERCWWWRMRWLMRKCIKKNTWLTENYAASVWELTNVFKAF